MLIHPHDGAHDEAEWRAFLADHPFGQLVVPTRDLPVIVPTHYALDGDRVLMHFARPNPVFEALRESPRAVFSVIGDYVYVPTSWNAEAGEPPEWGVPTSYYASVQLSGECEVVDGGEGMAAILKALLARLQPEGGHREPAPGANPYGAQFPGIRGVVLHVRDVRAKLKYGGNRTREHRLRVADLLARRDGPMDAEARAHILRRLSR